MDPEQKFQNALKAFSSSLKLLVNNECVSVMVLKENALYWEIFKMKQKTMLCVRFLAH